MECFRQTAGICFSKEASSSKEARDTQMSKDISSVQISLSLTDKNMINASKTNFLSFALMVYRQ